MAGGLTLRRRQWIWAIWTLIVGVGLPLLMIVWIPMAIEEGRGYAGEGVHGQFVAETKKCSIIACKARGTWRADDGRVILEAEANADLYIGRTAEAYGFPGESETVYTVYDRSWLRVWMWGSVSVLIGLVCLTSGIVEVRALRRALE